MCPIQCTCWRYGSLRIYSDCRDLDPSEYTIQQSSYLNMSIYSFLPHNNVPVQVSSSVKFMRCYHNIDREAAFD